MSKNTMYTFVSLFVVVLIGLSGGYWAVKKIRAKMNQEYPYQWTGTLIKEDVSEDEFRAAILGGAALDDTIEGLKLVERWSLPDGAAAKERLEAQLTVKVVDQEATVTFKDKDETLAQEVLTELLMSFEKRQSVVRDQQAETKAAEDEE